MQRNADPSRARGGDGDAEPAGAGPRAPGHRHRQHGNAALLRGETVVRSSRPRAEDRMVGCISLNFTGMKRMASARKRSRSSGSSKKPTKRSRYVVCLENKGHPRLSRDQKGLPRPVRRQRRAGRAREDHRRIRRGLPVSDALVRARLGAGEGEEGVRARRRLTRSRRRSEADSEAGSQPLID